MNSETTDISSIPGARILRPRAAILSVDKLGASSGNRVLFTDVSLEIPAHGIVALMGPGGSGKSSLLRALCGQFGADRGIRFRGTATYLGRPLGTGEYPTLVRQKADILLGTVFECISGSMSKEIDRSEKMLRIKVLLRCLELTELLEVLDAPMLQVEAADRKLALLVRGIATNARLMCVDEPTADLGAADARRIVRVLERAGRTRAILLVTHKQSLAHDVACSVALMNDRRLIAHLRTDEFFTSDDPMIAAYVRTGGLPHGSGEAFSWDDVSESEFRPYVSELRGPTGFRWLEAGRLAGAPMPGLVKPIEDDIKSLTTVGVTSVLSLNDEAPVEGLRAAGLTVRHAPFADMHPPTFEEARELSRQLVAWVEAGEVTVVHCKAGIGRTGTILACYLIYRGASASFALRHVRTIEPSWVQSRAQEEFLPKFEQWLGSRSHEAGANQPPTNQSTGENNVT